MTPQQDDLFQDLLHTFQFEAADHLEVLNKALLRLERTTDKKQRDDLLQEAFRAAHNLKGAARIVNVHDIEGLAHALESVLHQAQLGRAELDPAACDVLYATLDAVKHLLNGQDVTLESVHAKLAAIGGEASSAESQIAVQLPMSILEPTVPSDDMIRVAVSKLDNLTAQSSELAISKISAAQHLSDIEGIRRQLVDLPGTWREIKALLPRVNGAVGQQLLDVLTRQQEQLQTLARDIDLLHQSINRDNVYLGIVANRIQSEVRRVRMVPFQTMVLTLERVVRDAARSEEKQVAPLTVEGSEIELDKKVLEALKDSLIHLLRNAVSHGIENTTARLAAGKPAEGHITITIQQHGSEASIVIGDDGHGFDLDALRQKSASNGGEVLDEHANVDEIIGLAFLPGLTTANSVTAIAGRGVGLDVVHQCVEALHGRIVVDSVAGQGASIQLLVPVSLAMTRGLLVRIGTERYMLPLLSVEKILEPGHSFTVEGKRMITIDEKPCLLVSLAAVLGRSTGNIEPGEMLTVVLRVAEQRVALLVEDVLTDQEFAVKPLSKLLRQVPNVTGAALLGNGQPVIVLNAADLIRSARGVPRIDSSTNDQKPNGQSSKHGPQDTCILVVDDSITTRTLEKNILQASGYTVITAIDGKEALQQLHEHKVALVVSDVQMPNMDGFALTRYLRDSSDYAHLPVILVTSVDSRDGREQGLLAGANAYIVKRGFDQAELLSIIGKLL